MICILVAGCTAIPENHDKKAEIPAGDWKGVVEFQKVANSNRPEIAPSNIWLASCNGKVRFWTDGVSNSVQYLPD